MKKNNARKWTRALAMVLTVATMLTLFALPASAKSAGGFQYFVNGPEFDDDEPTVTVTGHKSAVNGTLTIPEKLNGYTVTEINEGAFAGRTDITKVVLPKSVRWVDAHAFEDCTKLRALTIDAAYVSAYAFSGCTALKKVTITAYKGDLVPDWDWNETGNEALFAADWKWTHYKKDYADVTTYLETRTGKKVTLTAEYGPLKSGESYHWYGVDIDPAGDDYWEDCTGESVTCKIWYSGFQYAVCEVRNKKGDVVWSQEFMIDAERSLADKVETAFYNSYLYGVTDYTKNHFRWRLEEMLEKMGIYVYDC